MNVNIPPFNSFVSGIDESDSVYFGVVHAARSRAGKIMTFHIHLDNSAHYSLVPLNKLFHKKNIENKLNAEDLQMWDCFSNFPEAIKFSYFEFRKVYVISLKMYGEYLFTFDFNENFYSDSTKEYKQGHFIKLENGNFGIYPNNNLLFEDNSYAKINLDNIPKLKRQNEEDYISVEYKKQ